MTASTAAAGSVLSLKHKKRSAGDHWTGLGSPGTGEWVLWRGAELVLWRPAPIQTLLPLCEAKCRSAGREAALESYLSAGALAALRSQAESTCEGDRFPHNQISKQNSEVVVLSCGLLPHFLLGNTILVGWEELLGVKCSSVQVSVWRTACAWEGGMDTATARKCPPLCFEANSWPEGSKEHHLDSSEYPSICHEPSGAYTGDLHCIVGTHKPVSNMRYWNWTVLFPNFFQLLPYLYHL